MGTHYRVWNNRRRCSYCVALDALFIAVAVVVYCTNTWLLKPLTCNAFVHGYLNDLFAMPFIISYSNLLIWLSGRFEFRLITTTRIALFTILCCIAWEGIAPLVVPNACSDMFDCLIYSVGAFAYFTIVRLTRSTGATYENQPRGEKTESFAYIPFFTENRNSNPSAAA